MKRLFWGAIALTLALAGCVQAEEGGQTSADSPAGETAAASGALAEAFVEAARVHAMVARNNPSGATAAVSALRTDLELAKENAPLAEQSRINELDQLAIQTQQAIDTNPSGALESSSRLIDEMQVALGGAPSELSPSGGGAGSGSDLDTPGSREAAPPNAPIGPSAPDRNAPVNQAPNGPAGPMNQPAPGTESGTGAPVNTAP